MSTYRREHCGMIRKLRNDSHETVRGLETAKPGGPRRATARLAMVLLSVAAAAAASPMAARAQIHISNNVSPNVFSDGITQGTVGQSTLHLVQPFRTPAGSGKSIRLENVILHFTNMPLLTSQVKLYLYRSKPNPNPPSPPGFAPTVPDAGRIDQTTHALPVNDPGRILEFRTPTHLGENRYRFAAPGNTLSASTTYHLYLWSVPHLDGPRWKTVDITATPGGSPGDVHFTGNTFQCSSGWTLLRGLSDNPVITADDGWIPYSKNTFVTEIIGRPNHDPGRPPTISGTAKVGEELTAHTSSIMDDNGPPSSGFTYQWQRVDADGNSNPEDIAGATSQTYTLVEADQGGQVRVTVRFNDDDCYENEASSVLSGVVSPEDNIPAAGLAMSGAAKVGETLTAETDNIVDANSLTPPVSYTYRWQRVDADGNSNPEDIAGATSQTYTLVEDDQDRRVRVSVRFNDNDGNPEELSVLSGVVSSKDNVLATGLAMSGTAKVGETLTAETGSIVDPDGLPPPVSYTYRWQRVDADGNSNPEDIAGATSQTYTLVEDDQGKRVRVSVRFNDNDGNPEELGVLSGVVSPEDNIPATGLAMSGTAKVGETLTAETDNIVDDNGLTPPLSYTYRWQRVDADGNSNPEDIAGATSQTYTLVRDDWRKRVRVSVKFNDNDGNPEELGVLSGVVSSEDNIPATGLAMSGTAKVGETLTAETAGIVDDNVDDNVDVPGPTPPLSYTYRWQRVDADGNSNPEDIAGATSQTYTLVENDQGRRVRVTVSFEDALRNIEMLSVLSDEVLPEDNVPATGLTMNGTARVGTAAVGETLTAETAGIVDANGLPPAVPYTYQWQRVDADGNSNPEDIAGATSQTYTLVENDQGRRVRVTVRFNDNDGNPEELSVLSGVVSPEDNIPATGLAMSGTAEVGETLTAETAGIEDANGPTLSDFTYQWQRVDADGSSNPEDIAGATSQTYTLVEDDQGRRVRVTVRFNDNDGNPEELSALSGVVVSRTREESQVVDGELSQFGGAVTGQVLDGVQQRLDAPRVEGVQATFAGQHFDWSRASRGPDWEGTAANTLRALSTLNPRELLTGSSLLFSGETARGGYASVWTRGAYGGYAGKEDEVEIDGSVRTGQLGADWTSGPWMLGVSVAHSVGESDYRHTGITGEGEIETSLTGIYPYARHEFTERNSVWVVAGHGEGSLKLTPKDGNGRGEVETDIGLTMGAAGLRVEVLEEDDEAVAISLALKADATFVSMTSKAVTGRLSATSPDTNRVRIGLEGSRRIVLDNGATLIPSAEIGARHDRGSISAGTGADVGAGVVYANPAHGLSVDLRGRSLIMHETSGTREWGVTGAVRYEADPSTEQGFATSLDLGYGAQASGGMDALFALDKLEDMEAEDETLPGGRLNAEVGYGLRTFGDRFISRPSASLGLTETGSVWRLGWWVTPARAGPVNLSGGIDLDPRDAEYRIGLRFDARF